MPTATKKTNISTTKVTEDIKTSVLDIEKEELKKQIEEMKAQMEAMTKLISAKEEKEEKIKAPERQISFVNMTSGTCVLKGSSVYRIEGQFKSRSFLEREARIIVNNMKNAIEQGYIYIANADFVKENDLDLIYENLLSDKELRELFGKNPQVIIETYKTVNEGQKQIIVNMIQEAKENNKYIDANVLLEIGKLSGVDLINNHYDE